MKALIAIALASLTVTALAAGQAHAQRPLPAQDPANQVKTTPADRLPKELMGLAITRFDAKRTSSPTGPDSIRMVMVVSNRSSAAINDVTWSVSTWTGFNWKELAGGPLRKSLAAGGYPASAVRIINISPRSPHPLRLKLVVRGQGVLETSKEITVQ